VALAAIRAVAKVKIVYVMDLHGPTYLFDFPTFKKILDLHRLQFLPSTWEKTKGLLEVNNFPYLRQKFWTDQVQYAVGL
jgi:hypothetical protein